MDNLKAILDQYLADSRDTSPIGVVARAKRMQQNYLLLLQGLVFKSDIINTQGTGDEFLSDEGIYKPVSAGGGSGSPSYIHTQAISATTWTVTHNLGFKPNLRVEDSSDRDVIGGEVEYLNNNSLTITFAFPFSGKAYLS